VFGFSLRLVCVVCIVHELDQPCTQIGLSNKKDNGSGTTNETSDKITGKGGNGTRQARTYTWASDISPSLNLFMI
jgi:hypothetical protein